MCGRSAGVSSMAAGSTQLPSLTHQQELIAIIGALLALGSMLLFSLTFLRARRWRDGGRDYAPHLSRWDRVQRDPGASCSGVTATVDQTP